MDLLPHLFYPIPPTPTTTTTATGEEDMLWSSPATTASTTSTSEPSSPLPKTYDLILVGASGFVGKLATMHMIKRYGVDPSTAKFSWALSARNASRLQKVHDEISVELEEWWEKEGKIQQQEQQQQQQQQQQQKQKTKKTKKIPAEEKMETTEEEEEDAETFVENCLRSINVIYGDVDDPAFARTLAQQAKVIAASLTPYSVHGTNLVEACVAHGTHYVDISGEMLWIKENIDKYHDEAKEKGVRIVHACGLGSVPADLSAYMMLHRLHDDHVHADEIKFMMGPVYSSLGGGSMTSYATLIKAALCQGQISQLFNPHFLTPTKLQKNTHEVTVGSKLLGVGFDMDVWRFTAPLWLAALDDQVVVRSAGLLGYPSFRYTEAQTYSFSLFGIISAFFTWIAAYTLAGCLLFPPTRWLLTKLRPPGSGPNRLLREKGYGVAYAVGKGTNPGGGKVTYVSEFKMPGGDPGYLETSKMLVESALCLVLDMDKLPHQQHRGGVLTPAAAFGEVLMDRLHRASGMAFKL